MFQHFKAFLRAAQTARHAFRTLSRKLPQQERVVGVPDKRTVAADKARRVHHSVANLQENFGAVGVYAPAPRLVGVLKRALLALIRRTKGKRLAVLVLKLLLKQARDIGIFASGSFACGWVKRALAGVVFQYGRDLELPARQNFVADFLFITLLAGRVKDAANKLVRQILLGNPVVAVSVRIQVARAVAKAFSVAVCVAQMVGDIRVFFFHRRERVKKGHRRI